MSPMTNVDSKKKRSGASLNNKVVQNVPIRN